MANYDKYSCENLLRAYTYALEQADNYKKWLDMCGKTYKKKYHAGEYLKYITELHEIEQAATRKGYNVERAYGTRRELRREASKESVPGARTDEVRRSTSYSHEERRHVRLVFDPTERATDKCPTFGFRCERAASKGEWCELCRRMSTSGSELQGQQRSDTAARAECEDRMHRVRRELERSAETGVSSEVPRVPRYMAVVADAAGVSVYLPVSDDCGGGP